MQSKNKIRRKKEQENNKQKTRCKKKEAQKIKTLPQPQQGYNNFVS
jgi:hypothetical protein